MMTNYADVTDLLKRYLNNDLNRREYDELFSHLSLLDNDQLSELVDEVFKQIELESKSTTILQKDDVVLQQVYSRILSHIQQTSIAERQDEHMLYRKLYRWGIAASLVFLLGIGSFFSYRLLIKSPSDQIQLHDVNPAITSAVLTLGNDEVINLDTAVTGVIYEGDGFKIMKDKYGEISYEYADNSMIELVNKVETPKAKFSSVVLPDGSKVYLNAMSSLEFPVKFTKNTREVTLKGEGYFEVSKDQTRPFIVHTENQRVEVLGTIFNINAYATKERGTLSTLVEGKVRVVNADDASVILSPGQQAINKTELVVKQVNVQDIVAWKDGRFIFDHASLFDVLGEIERWYDVQFVFEGKNIDDQPLVGSVKRTVMLSEILKVMEMSTNYKFEIKERKVYVSR